MSNLLAPILAILLTYGYFFLLRKQAQKPAMLLKGGARKMIVPKLYYAVFLVAILFATLLCLSFSKAVDAVQIVFLIVMLALMVFMGVYVLLFTQRHAVTYNESVIKSVNWKSVQKELFWEDIENIHYNRLRGVYELHTESDKVCLHFHLVGINEFLQYLYKRKGLHHA